jgi:glyoxylase-like metal-dependent hydrolase (beta-lactamase superfamily II)
MTGQRNESPAGHGTTADGWFAVRLIAPDTYCFTETLGEVHPRFGLGTTHSYLLLGQERAAVIDAGFGIGDLLAGVRAITSLPLDLCISHGHWDHYGSSAQFLNILVGAPDASAISVPPSPEMQEMIDDVPGRCRRPTPTGFEFAHWRTPVVEPTRRLADRDIVDLGGRRLVAHVTPGHTPGSVCYLDAATGLLFTGDTVFRGDMHVDLGGGDAAAFAQSLARLSAMGGYDAICPAHYETPLPVAFLNAVAAHVAAWGGDGAMSAPDEFDVVRPTGH